MSDNERSALDAQPVEGSAPHVVTPAMERAVELARALLRAQGMTEEEIERELERPPGSGLARF